MRSNLKKARKDAGMTKQAVADKLGITLRYYGMIEGGYRQGSQAIWDKLEDLFGVHQRVLRACKGAADKIIQADI